MKAINKDHVNYMVLPLHVDKIWMPLERPRHEKPYIKFTLTIYKCGLNGNKPSDINNHD